MSDQHFETGCICQPRVDKHILYLRFTLTVVQELRQTW